MLRRPVVAVGAEALPREHLRQILAAGIRAPSAENRHYLRFEPTGAAVSLLATDHGSWAAQPHRKWLALMAYGAVAENMALRAGALGYAQHVRWQPEPGRPDCMAQFSWVATGEPADPLAAAIDARHTNRRFYRREPVEAQALQQVAKAAQGVPGAQVRWCDAAPARGLALRALRLAETERFRRRELHGELFSAVRFEQGWRAAADEGLPPGALEVEAAMRLPFQALRHWPVMRGASFVGAHWALGLRAGFLPCALAPHIGLLLAQGDGEDERDLLAGRALQRVWLAAHNEGLAFQPFAAPVALSRQRPGGGWVGPALQRRLDALLEELTLGHEGRAAMFFRVGRAPLPATRTARLPLECYGIGAFGNDE